MKPALRNDINGDSPNIVALAVYELLDDDIVSKAAYVRYTRFVSIPDSSRFIINLFYDQFVIKIVLNEFECSVWSRSLKFEPDLLINISAPNFQELLNVTISKLYYQGIGSQWIS